MNTVEKMKSKIKSDNASFLDVVYTSIEKRSTDVELDHAMLAWNRNTKRVTVVRHPDVSKTFQRLNLSSDIGASGSGWIYIPTYERLLILSNKAHELFFEHDIPLGDTLKALDVIPEWRHMNRHARWA